MSGRVSISTPPGTSVTWVELRDDALDASMMEEILAALDPARVHVFTTACANFCVGGESGATLDLFHDRLVELCVLPVVVLCRGATQGVGMLFPAIADVVVATADATFAFPEVRRGALPGVVSVPSRRRLSRQQCRRWMLTGDAFDAPTAMSSGFVDIVVDSMDEAWAQLDLAVRGILGVGASHDVLRARKRILGAAGDINVAVVEMGRALSPEQSGEEAPASRLPRRRPTMAGDGELVRLSWPGPGVALLVLADPARAGRATTWQVASDLAGRVRQLRTNPGLTSVVIAGEGGSFRVGGDDPPWFAMGTSAGAGAGAGAGGGGDGNKGAGAPSLEVVAAATHDIVTVCCEVLRELPVPVAVVLQGRVGGAALALALSADLRVGVAGVELDYRDRGTNVLLETEATTQKCVGRAAWADFMGGSLAPSSLLMGTDTAKGTKLLSRIYGSVVEATEFALSVAENISDAAAATAATAATAASSAPGNRCGATNASQIVQSQTLAAERCVRFAFAHSAATSSGDTSPLPPSSFKRADSQTLIMLHDGEVVSIVLNKLTTARRFHQALVRASATHQEEGLASIIVHVDPEADIDMTCTRSLLDLIDWFRSPDRPMVVVVSKGADNSLLLPLLADLALASSDASFRVAGMSHAVYACFAARSGAQGCARLMLCGEPSLTGAMAMDLGIVEALVESSDSFRDIVQQLPMLLLLQQLPSTQTANRSTAAWTAPHTFAESVVMESCRRCRDEPDGGSGDPFLALVREIATADDGTLVVGENDAALRAKQCLVAARHRQRDALPDERSDASVGRVSIEQSGEDVIHIHVAALTTATTREIMRAMRTDSAIHIFHLELGKDTDKSLLDTGSAVDLVDYMRACALPVVVVINSEARNIMQSNSMGALPSSVVSNGTLPNGILLLTAVADFVIASEHKAILRLLTAQAAWQDPRRKSLVVDYLMHAHAGMQASLIISPPGRIDQAVASLLDRFQKISLPLLHACKTQLHALSQENAAMVIPPYSEQNRSRVAGKVIASAIGALGDGEEKAAQTPAKEFSVHRAAQESPSRVWSQLPHPWQAASHPLLQQVLRLEKKGVARYRGVFHPSLVALFKDCVADRALGEISLPCAGFLEMAIAAVIRTDVALQGSPTGWLNLSIGRLSVLGPVHVTEGTVVVCDVTNAGDNIAIRAVEGQVRDVCHIKHGLLSPGSAPTLGETHLSAIKEQCTIEDQQLLDRGPRYHMFAKAWRSDDGKKAVALLRVPPQETGAFHVHPLLLDSAMIMVSLVCADKGEIWLPMSVHDLSVQIPVKSMQVTGVGIWASAELVDSSPTTRVLNLTLYEGRTINVLFQAQGVEYGLGRDHPELLVRTAATATTGEVKVGRPHFLGSAGGSEEGQGGARPATSGESPAAAPRAVRFEAKETVPVSNVTFVDASSIQDADSQVKFHDAQNALNQDLFGPGGQAEKKKKGWQRARAGTGFSRAPPPTESDDEDDGEGAEGKGVQFQDAQNALSHDLFGPGGQAEKKQKGWQRARAGTGFRRAPPPTESDDDDESDFNEVCADYDRHHEAPLGKSPSWTRQSALPVSTEGEPYVVADLTANLQKELDNTLAQMTALEQERNAADAAFRIAVVEKDKIAEEAADAIAEALNTSITSVETQRDTIAVLEAEKEALEAEKRAIRTGELASLRVELTAHHDTIAVLEAEKEALEAEKTAIKTGELAGLHVELSAHHDTIAVLEAEKEALEAEKTAIKTDELAGLRVELSAHHDAIANGLRVELSAQHDAIAVQHDSIAVLVAEKKALEVENTSKRTEDVAAQLELRAMALEQHDTIEMLEAEKEGMVERIHQLEVGGDSAMAARIQKLESEAADAKTALEDAKATEDGFEERLAGLQAALEDAWEAAAEQERTIQEEDDERLANWKQERAETERKRLQNLDKHHFEKHHMKKKMEEHVDAHTGALRKALSASVAQQCSVAGLLAARKRIQTEALDHEDPVIFKEARARKQSMASSDTRLKKSQFVPSVTVAKYMLLVSKDTQHVIDMNDHHHGRDMTAHLNVHHITTDEEKGKIAMYFTDEAHYDAALAWVIAEKTAQVEKHIEQACPYASCQAARSARGLPPLNTPRSRAQTVSRARAQTMRTAMQSPGAAAAVEQGLMVATAKYYFEGSEDGDLTFFKGDEIVVLSRGEGDNWWRGRVGDQEGMFPGNYAEVGRGPRPPPPSSPPSAPPTSDLPPPPPPPSGRPGSPVGPGPPSNDNEGIAAIMAARLEEERDERLV